MARGEQSDPTAESAVSMVNDRSTGRRLMEIQKVASNENGSYGFTGVLTGELVQGCLTPPPAPYLPFPSCPRLQNRDGVITLICPWHLIIDITEQISLLTAARCLEAGYRVPSGRAEPGIPPPPPRGRSREQIKRAGSGSHRLFRNSLMVTGIEKIPTLPRQLGQCLRS